MATVEVDSVEVAIEKGSLYVDDIIEARSTAGFTVVDTLGTAQYLKGMPVVIDDDGATKIFGGVVESSEERRISPKDPTLYHIIRCIDWHYLADKRLAAESYEDKTCGYIVSDLVTNYLAGEAVTEGEVQLGPTLSTCVINYVRISDALDKLAESAGFIWYIDQDKKLYFVDRSTYTSPWIVTEALILKGTASYTHANPKYRNRQYVRGGKALTDVQTEDFTGDGTTLSFALGYPCAKVPTITEDAGAKTVGIKGIDTGKDYYWSKGDEIIVAAVAPAGAVAVRVVYYGEYNIIVLAEEEDAIVAQLALEGAGTGYNEAMADEPNITDRDTAVDSALSKLRKYAVDGNAFKFSVATSGLRAGQLAKITHSAYGLSVTEMLLESVRITRAENHLQYAVRAIEGPVIGGWTQLFRDMATTGLSYGDVNIGSGVLIILKLVEADWEWGSAYVATVWTCPICGPATLCGPTTIVC